MASVTKGDTFAQGFVDKAKRRACQKSAAFWYRHRHHMFPKIKQVRHLGEYRLKLAFTDGTTGAIDLRERVVGRGGVFAPLQDVDFFSQVRVDPEAGTIIWPNDVDFCPDVLYSLVTGEPIQLERRARPYKAPTIIRQPRRPVQRTPARTTIG